VEINEGREGSAEGLERHKGAGGEVHRDRGDNDFRSIAGSADGGLYSILKADAEGQIGDVAGRVQRQELDQLDKEFEENERSEKEFFVSDPGNCQRCQQPLLSPGWFFPCGNAFPGLS
jgi:hypothetical protein